MSYFRTKKGKRTLSYQGFKLFKIPTLIKNQNTLKNFCLKSTLVSKNTLKNLLNNIKTLQNLSYYNFRSLQRYKYNDQAHSPKGKRQPNEKQAESFILYAMW